MGRFITMRMLAVLIVVTAVGVAGFCFMWGIVPPRWNPWATLDFQEEPNLVTRFKFKRLAHDPARCAAALATSDLQYTMAPSNDFSAKCPVENAVRIGRVGDVKLGGSFAASCPLAAAFAMFVQHGLQDQAMARFGSRVVEVDHFGSYACRNVYNRKEGRLSQHASANALDISGFKLANGMRIVIAKDWSGESTDGLQKARFLRDAAKEACRSFNVVLGPDYNAEHYNHFHVDMSNYWYCPSTR